jgi:hypothetical protein
MSQSAPPLTGSLQSPNKILSSLSVSFFGVGLLAWPFLWAMRANAGVALVFILFFLALALIFGLISCPRRVRWGVVTAMVVIELVVTLMIGVGDWYKDAEHYSRLNHGLFFVLDLVVLFVVCVIVSGVMSWLLKVLDKLRTRSSLSPAPPPANLRVFSWLALGFFIVGLLGCPFLIAIHANEHAAVIFSGLCLLLALILGIISWRERLGRVIVILTIVLLVLEIVLMFLRN